MNFLEKKGAFIIKRPVLYSDKIGKPESDLECGLFQISTSYWLRRSPFYLIPNKCLLSNTGTLSLNVNNRTIPYEAWLVPLPFVGGNGGIKYFAFREVAGINIRGQGTFEITFDQRQRHGV